MILDLFLRITVIFAAPALIVWAWDKLDPAASRLPDSLYTLYLILSISAMAALVLIIWLICWRGALP